MRFTIYVCVLGVFLSGCVATKHQRPVSSTASSDVVERATITGSVVVTNANTVITQPVSGDSFSRSPLTIFGFTLVVPPQTLWIQVRDSERKVYGRQPVVYKGNYMPLTWEALVELPSFTSSTAVVIEAFTIDTDGQDRIEASIPVWYVASGTPSYLSY